MSFQFLSSFNWVDILIIVIAARVIFIGAQKGLVIELFKLIGIFLTTFFTLHFYIRLGKFLHKFLFIPVFLEETISFIFLVILFIVIFKFIRDGFLLLIKAEAQPTINQWGGAIVGSLRSILICGLIINLFFVIGTKYLANKAQNSFFGYYLVDLSPKIYEACYKGFVSKLFPNEEYNKEVFSLKNPSEKKKEK